LVVELVVKLVVEAARKSSPYIQPKTQNPKLKTRSLPLLGLAKYFKDLPTQPLLDREATSQPQNRVGIFVLTGV